MNLKKKFVIGAASLALVAGMGVAPAMAAPIPLLGGGTADLVAQRVSGLMRMVRIRPLPRFTFLTVLPWWMLSLVACCGMGRCCW